MDSKIKTVKGSVLNPDFSGLKFVLSMASMEGKTDGVMFETFDKKWKKVKDDVKSWYFTRTGAYKLGAIRQTAVQSDVWVTSLLCQTLKKDKTLTDDKALGECIKALIKEAKYEKASVHVSDQLLKEVPLLEKHLEDVLKAGISVKVYSE